MNLQTLLGDLPQAQFVEQYFHRLPFSMSGAARPACELATWEVWQEILRQDAVDLMIVRDGQQLAGPAPKTADEARALSDDGYTILVRHAERHHAPLSALAESFRADFRAPVNVHLYATPPGRHGFSWHYDAEDVFILQTSGEKEYSLRKNTVHPWPLEETIPADMQYPREIMPLMRVNLTAGDWLYIPCGYWHKAEAGDCGQTAISIALGVMSPSALDVFDFLRPRLAASLIWRSRLPVDGTASGESRSDIEANYRDLFEQLGRDFARQLADDQFIRDFVDRHEANARNATD